MMSSSDHEKSHDCGFGNGSYTRDRRRLSTVKVSSNKDLRASVPKKAPVDSTRKTDATEKVGCIPIEVDVTSDKSISNKAKGENIQKTYTEKAMWQRSFPCFIFEDKLVANQSNIRGKQSFNAIMVKATAVLLILISVSVCTAQSTENFEFYVMGDTPYNQQEEFRLVQQLQQIPITAKFVFHVGDIMEGKGANCLPEIYQDRAQRLSKSPAPVYIIPGDNDYLECSRPDVAWNQWFSTFNQFYKKWNNNNMNTQHQPERKENFAFFKRGVLFMGLHNVGAVYLNNQAELNYRDADASNWIRQNLNDYRGDSRLQAVILFGHAQIQNSTTLFLDDLVDAVITELPVSMPVYYIHGDGHRYEARAPFPNAPNIISIMVDSGGAAPPLKFTIFHVQEESDNQFTFPSTKLVRIDRQGGPYL